MRYIVKVECLSAEVLAELKKSSRIIHIFSLIDNTIALETEDIGHIKGLKEVRQAYESGKAKLMLTGALNKIGIFDVQNQNVYGDGGQTRDFTFVRDVVQANVLAMESDATGVFNVATGTRISVNDLTGMVMGIVGNRVDCVHEMVRAGDVRDSLGDISKAHEGFEYVPRYGMEDGLKETIGWFMRGT